MTRLMLPTWGPPGSCLPQVGPMKASWTLLYGLICNMSSDINVLKLLLNLPGANELMCIFIQLYISTHLK